MSTAQASAPVGKPETTISVIVSPAPTGSAENANVPCVSSVRQAAPETVRLTEGGRTGPTGTVKR